MRKIKMEKSQERTRMQAKQSPFTPRLPQMQAMNVNPQETAMF